jgi:LPXTG-site transpeptidase (sortase) family protein
MSFLAPSIDVAGPLRRTSAVNGVVNPPSGTLAWITGYGRVRPGEVGTAVIAGHVVNGRRADVFYDLQSIRRGDKVTVFDAAGKGVVYTVTATRVATKLAVSRDAAVWGANRSVKRIALITCDDDDGFRADGHRVSNFVAIAEAR